MAAGAGKGCLAATAAHCRVGCGSKAWLQADAAWFAKNVCGGRYTLDTLCPGQIETTVYQEQSEAAGQARRELGMAVVHKAERHADWLQANVERAVEDAGGSRLTSGTLCSGHIETAEPQEHEARQRRRRAVNSEWRSFTEGLPAVCDAGLRDVRASLVAINGMVRRICGFDAWLHAARSVYPPFDPVADCTAYLLHLQRGWACPCRATSPFAARRRIIWSVIGDVGAKHWETS
eukprot:NODE_12789_length_1204_cov_3.544104.p2 GENE.NODE_12789_length_1204_cov_3.544104~~NODE_12789_length_1204_cov_3.544104.p2  ORF type:complete len:234 (+),score=30.46 NODE_12789_length_1204_cov_3.544104:406-1107(+)